MDGTSLLAMQLNLGMSIWLLMPILIPLGWLWVTQFIQLMLMPENDFPGRQDKLIWGAAFIVMFFFAPFAFWGWKLAYVDRLETEVKPEDKKKRESSTEA